LGNLVEQFIKKIRQCGRIATPTEARKMLELKGAEKVKI
jgi:uncharacterized protein (DUF849 family)